MGMVYTTCPVSGQSLATGIDTDQVSLDRTPPFTARVHCPHCGHEHEWTKERAWVAGNSGHEKNS
jgi:hypothetical protein